MPTSQLLKRMETPTDPASPMATPRRVCTSADLRTSPTTRPRPAPMANRMPTSLVTISSSQQAMRVPRRKIDALVRFIARAEAAPVAEVDIAVVDAADGEGLDRNGKGSVPRGDDDVRRQAVFAVGEARGSVLAVVDNQPGGRVIRILPGGGNELNDSLKYVRQCQLPFLNQTGDGKKAIEFFNPLLQLLYTCL